MVDQIRLAELLAALSLTSDLGSGVAFEKGLRTCLVAGRPRRGHSTHVAKLVVDTASLLGMDEAERATLRLAGLMPTPRNSSLERRVGT